MILDYDLKSRDGRKLVLYGCGEDCEIISSRLDELGVNDYYLCDTVKTGVFRGKEIMFPDSVIDECSDVIIASGKYCVEIYRELKRSGVADDHIFIGEKLYISHLKDYEPNEVNKAGKKCSYSAGITRLKAEFDSRGWYLVHLDLIITEKCTLNCECCGSLMPMYKEPCNYDLNDLIDAVDRLLNSGCYIGTLDLIGGEPLVNQSVISGLIEKYGMDRRIGCFELITNGTIDVKDELLDKISSIENVYVIFSNYGKLSLNQNNCFQRLRDAGVQCYIESDEDITISNGTLWIYYGDVKHFDFPKEKHKRMYDNCMDGKFCATMLRGKLFICPRIAHAYNLGLIPESVDSLYLDYSNDDSRISKGEAVKFFNPSDYPMACEWCNRDAGVLVERARQIPRR